MDRRRLTAPQRAVIKRRHLGQRSLAAVDPDGPAVHEMMVRRDFTRAVAGALARSVIERPTVTLLTDDLWVELERVGLRVVRR